MAASWLDQEVVNPATGNKVKVKSLPAKEREKYKPKATHALNFTQLPVGHGEEGRQRQQKTMSRLLNKHGLDGAMLMGGTGIGDKYKREDDLGSFHVCGPEDKVRDFARDVSKNFKYTPEEATALQSKVREHVPDNLFKPQEEKKKIVQPRNRTMPTYIKSTDDPTYKIN